MTQKKTVTLLSALILILLVAVIAIVLNRGNEDAADKPQGNSQTDNQSEADAALLGEAFTNSEAGVSMQIPKGWQLAPRNDEDPGSITKFVKGAAGGSTAGQANGELIVRQSEAHIDDIVRPYLEAAMNINATPKLISNHDVRIGKRVVRLLSQEMPGPNGMPAGRITQYIFYYKGAYYILSYTMLASDFESQQPGLEASLQSLKITK